MAKKKKRRLRKSVRRAIYVMIAIIFAIISFNVVKNALFSRAEEKEEQKETKKEEQPVETNNKEAEEKEAKYKECMQQPYKMETLDQEFNDLMASYEGKSLGLYFTDINNNYSYNLNPNVGYYSGCVTKIFGTIYLLEKARAGEIDLNQKLQYLPQDKRPFSDLMDQHSFYEELPITTLISYYMEVSDNTAFFIIIREFGAQAINDYMLEKHGITLHFTNDHPFEAYYTAELGNESLKILYEDLKVDDEYSAIVKKAMDNDSENGLNFDNLRFLHKYGEYDIYHNDIGIYDSDNPYLVTILTHYAYDDYIGKISSINKSFYEIYQKNLEEKEKYCRSIN